MPIQPKQQPPYYTPIQINKIYKALLTQLDTDAPTIHTQINTIGEITWTRVDIGNYEGTPTTPFTINNTYLSITQNREAAIFSITNEETVIRIRSQNSSFLAADELLNSTPITIEIIQ